MNPSRDPFYVRFRAFAQGKRKGKKKEGGPQCQKKIQSACACRKRIIPIAMEKEKREGKKERKNDKMAPIDHVVFHT